VELNNSPPALLPKLYSTARCYHSVFGSMLGGGRFRRIIKRKVKLKGMGGGAWPSPCPIIGTPPLRSPAIEIESRQLIKLAPISDTNLASTSRGASGAPPPPLTRVWERRALSPYFIFLEEKKAPTNRLQSIMDFCDFPSSVKSQQSRWSRTAFASHSESFCKSL